jgi:hypothetical protein
MGHYLIIGIIIAGIVFLQFRSYYVNRQKLRTFEETFPDDHRPFTLTKVVSGIKSEYQNPILDVIIDSINNYLSNNKGAVSDFHIIKDIVDRNCDAAEEEINTQVPIPLYYGLMGTMAGILIGVGFLVAGGGLDELLGAGGATGNGVSGIQTLMGGVALAMVSSIIGILLTTIGSFVVKNGKATIEKNKNIFLSWMQAELLPILSADTAGTLVKLTQNLSDFNEAFSSNTQELKETLQQVNASYQSQAEILAAINKMKITKIASANIEVYDKLKNCTDEIGYFSLYLKGVNEYIANVNSLNEKLDRNEARTKAIEEMGAFFKAEVKQIEARKGAISAAVGTVDATLQNALTQLKENADAQFNTLNQATVTQTEKLGRAINEQQTALQKKLEEVPVIVAELKNLTAVKMSMEKLAKASLEQNKKINTLAKEIKALAEVKAAGGSVKLTIPFWLKMVAVVGGGSVAIYYVFSILSTIVKILDKIL